ASGLLNTTQQVGGSLGLAILTAVSTSRITSAPHHGLPLPLALTQGFKGAFVVAGIFCGAGAAVALVALPRRARVAEDGTAARAALSSSRCPSAPNCGHLARVAAFGGRLRKAAHMGCSARHS